jgi:hypothetical protein
MISSDGTASGGPVQQQKLRRMRVSIQASRNRHWDSQGRLRENEYVITCFGSNSADWFGRSRTATVSRVLTKGARGMGGHPSHPYNHISPLKPTYRCDKRTGDCGNEGVEAEQTMLGMAWHGTYTYRSRAYPQVTRRPSDSHKRMSIPVNP